MVRMEKSKYSTPRFSEALKDIASFLGCLNDPVKHDDDLSRDDSQGRDIATSDSHFSGFSRFSTSNRPSGFAMAPPPEGVRSPKALGNAGSTLTESPYRSSMLTNKGHNNAGAGQKADQKGGNDGGTHQATGKYQSDKSSKDSRTLQLNAKYGSTDQNQLDVIVENESQYASTHGVLAAIEKHATETVGQPFASKRHSQQHRVSKRRSRTQVTNVLTETDERGESPNKGGLTNQVAEISDQVRQIQSKRLTQQHPTLAPALEHHTPTNVGKSIFTNSNHTPNAKNQHSKVFHSAKQSHSLSRTQYPMKGKHHDFNDEYQKSSQMDYS